MPDTDGGCLKKERETFLAKRFGGITGEEGPLTDKSNVKEEKSTTTKKERKGRKGFGKD